VGPRNRTRPKGADLPTYRWTVDAQAHDDTDAAIVSDLLEATLRDERGNDPDEVVDVTYRPLDGPDVVDERERDR
jgi:hypothetical protein